MDVNDRAKSEVNPQGSLGQSQANLRDSHHDAKHLRWIHDVCSAFEARWPTPQHVSIESLIAENDGAEDELLLAWLIQSELELRSNSGHVPKQDEYLRRFPHFSHVVQRAFVEVERDGRSVEAVAACVAMTLDIDEQQRQSSRISDALHECPPFASLQPSTLPAELGPYRLEEEIARGGMGIVYRATHVPLQREVAIKVMRAGQRASPAEIQRFRQESHAVARLDHPGIVPVYDVGASDRLHYFSMPLLERKSLAQRVSDSPIPPREAAQMMQVVARALHFAHIHGIVHRDLKPSNILFGKDNQPKVADFGLAKISVDAPRSGAAGSLSSELTLSGQILGTPAYMAPELATGKARVADFRSDVYSLGAVLYAALTGRPPFQAATPLETIRQLLDESLVAPRSLNPQIPLDLETIVLKCLAKSPHERYPTAEAVANDLQRFLDDQPIMARRAGSWEHAWRWCRRNPGWAAMITAVASLLTVIAVGASFLSAWALREETRAREQLFTSKLSEARAITLSQQSGQRFRSLELLDEARELAAELKLPESARLAMRNVAVSALSRPDLYPAYSWPGFPPGSQHVDFDAEFRLYARTDQAGHCSVRRIQDDKELFHLPPEGLGTNTYPYLTADASHIIILQGPVKEGSPAYAATIWRLDAAAGKPSIVFQVPDVLQVSPAIHSNQREIAFVSSVGVVSYYDLSTGKLIYPPLEPDTITREVVVAIHPTEPLLALGSYFSNLVLIRDLRDGRRVQVLQSDHPTIGHAWHPQGLELAICDGNEGRIDVFDARTWQRIRQLGPASAGAALCYNHRGDQIATLGWGGALKLFDARTGAKLAEQFQVRTSARLRFSKDDRHLAGFIDGENLGIWDYSDGRECRNLRCITPEGDIVYRNAAVSPNGRLLVGLMSDGICFWDLYTGKQCAFLELERPLMVEFERVQAPSAKDAANVGRLLVSDETGVYRWPIETVHGNVDRWKIGPPIPLPIPPSFVQPRQSTDGRYLVTSQRSVGVTEPWAGVWLWDAESATEPKHLLAGEDVWYATVSADGNWLLTVSDQPNDVQLWNLKLDPLVGRVVELPFGEPNFSPDGRWLYLGSRHGSVLVETSNWAVKRKLIHHGRFSHDSQLLAVLTPAGTIGLLGVPHAEDLLVLDNARQEGAGNFLFTSDDRSLITVNRRDGICVWDLELLRSQLRERGLDLQAAAPLANFSSPVMDHRPLQLLFETGEWEQQRLAVLRANLDRAVATSLPLASRWRTRAAFHWEQGSMDLALDDMEEALRRAEAADQSRLRARIASELSRMYSMAVSEFRDPHRAIELAELAMDLAPGNWHYATSLGMALFRASRLDEARTTLENSLANNTGHAQAADLYFLALVHQELGAVQLAREYLFKAHATLEKYTDSILPNDLHELQRFRQEAEAVADQVANP